MLAVLVVAPASARAAVWVGLGDSFAAGPLIPSQTLNPLGCLRSTRNYARLASAQLGVSLNDVSCSGARTTHMTASQSTDAGTNPPQFNGIASDTRFVSVQIGGNDIGFTEILSNCQTANPFGRPCQNRYVRNGVDELRARIAATAPKIQAVLAGIKARTGARIVMLNYEALLPSSGSGCWPQVPLAWADVPYVRGIQATLNDAVRRAAEATGSTYVDMNVVSNGHDACQPLGVRWVEPVLLGTNPVVVHPNALGESKMAAQALAVLGLP
jgi:hypothetical protein